MEILEEKLIDRVRTGDEDAFQVLVSRYKERGFRVCYSMVGNVEDAKDILQIAFVKAYKGIDKFRKRSSFYTWFYRILVNTAQDFLRKKAKEKTEPFESAADTAANPEKKVMDEELKRLLDEAISRLSERQRISFVMKHSNGMKIEEIARILNCRPATVKIHIFRAVKNIKNKLGPYLSVEG